jgi:hypothetical protein
MAFVEIIGQQPLIEVSSTEPAEVIITPGSSIRMNVVVDSKTASNITITASQGLPGAQGVQGPPGPNQVTTSTSTNITGILAGNGTTVEEAQMASGRLLGRSSSGTGDIEQITVGVGLQLSGGNLISTATGVPSGTASGTDTYAATIANVTGYNTNDGFIIKFTNANTGTATLNINGLGAKNIFKSVNVALSSGDIKAGQELVVVYDGVNFQAIGLAPTKAEVGLGNVDNTSDLNKPISTATQTALNGKENTITPGTTSQYFRGDKTFQTLDKNAVGLGNVDNTSDANKPISTATQTALNAKQDTLVSGNNIKSVNNNSLVGSGNLDVGTVTSVGLTMPTGFNVANSPVTGSNTLAVTGAGTAAQYIRGDGSLGNFPSSPSGGGSSITYYLNGSVNASVGGYKQLSKTPIIGTGTNISTSSNGVIAQFLTDAGDPGIINIPSGAWLIDFYFSASVAGGTPSFYVELLKYDGSTFTSIASNSATPEFILNGTSVDLYTTSISVPQTTLTVTDRLAIRVYVDCDGKTLTLYTENPNLSQVITTLSTGVATINNLSAQVQFFATGTSGTDFGISSTSATHTFNLPVASASNTGKLSSTDWSTFNDKPNGYYQNTTPTGTIPLESIWVHSDTGIQYIYINDGNSNQWVQSTLPLGPQGPQGANGTNTVNSLTATTFSGLLKGNGSTLSATTVGAELGYTPENVANKENVTLDSSSTKYPTNNLVKTSLDSFADDVDYAIMTNQRILFNF